MCLSIKKVYLIGPSHYTIPSLKLQAAVTLLSCQLSLEDLAFSPGSELTCVHLYGITFITPMAGCCSLLWPFSIPLFYLFM